MMFKPRIFLSSTLSENLNIRSKIEEFFSSIGAEAMLYEKNLTPSVDAMTYRKDIFDADFIIFIIKNKYGNKTEKGISGTHEEFQIALETNIPKHIYIKLENNESDAKELIEEIDNNQISYYYFKNDNDLLKRIKETTFTIAKEIMLRKIEEAQLPKNSVKKISVKYDYDQAIDIIKIIESMKRVNRLSEFDWTDSTIFDSFIETIVMFKSGEEWIFIDRKIEDLLDDLISIYEEFSCSHSNDFTSIPSTFRTIKVPVIGEVMISRCSMCSSPHLSRNQYIDIIRRFLEKYDEFREYIEKMRLFTDSIF
ncbi:DUF4062 domain-containing protein [Desulfosporosinus shakirovi]|uniref:DUF4062 domain-containing protein n=1 Tax=Desulfosporosinus shakirovi TaxID=2885154 RepID=UPI001E5F7D34|nr:DUF4062 domain-containing protein [Desulfosporosinus sp. SRJS8]MCB8817379.1 DUF4062 domain-containing protein [Desulfosporosinus sp. SRJS8]